MRVVKQINTKNRTYYFYNDIINLKNFKSNLLKIDKKSYKDISVYNIGYNTIKKTDDCENIYSVPLYLLINHANGYIEKKCVNEYLMLDSTDENKELLKNPLKVHNMTITIRSVFEKDGKLYPEVFLDDALYELNV